jgi:anti-sigma factor RsiW
MMRCALDRETLNAYADQSLAREELTAVEAHLRGCADCAAEALALVQMKRATRAAAAGFALKPEFRMRPEFRLQMERSLETARRPMWRRAWLPVLAVAGMALLLIAVSASVLMQHGGRDEVIAESLDLHVAALARSNPVKPCFQGKLPFTFNLPELDGSQYRLLGGKLVYLHHEPAAQLLFEIRKHPISVFLVEEQKGLAAQRAAVQATSERGFSVETWRKGGLRYVAISDTNPADVHELGEMLRGAGR